MAAKQNVPGVEGSDYEVYNLALFSLKCLLSDKISDFTIESNNAKFGLFDDVILTLKTTSNSEIKTAFQLKHKITAKNVQIKQLEQNEGNFSVGKYFNSYNNISCNDKESYHYVLFTNNNFNHDESKSELFAFEPLKETPLFNDFLDICTPEKIFKFKNKIDPTQNEFLNRFYFFANQMDVNSVGAQIHNIFVETFKLTVETSTRFIDLFRDLQKGRFTDKVINKETVILHLINLMLLPRSVNLNLHYQDETIQTERLKNFLKATQCFDVTLIIHNEIVKNDLKCIEILSDSESELKWAKMHKLIYRDQKFSQATSENMNTLYSIDEYPLILNYSEESAPLINSVINICRSKFPHIKFILVSNKNDANVSKNIGNLLTSNIFKTLTDLEIKSRSAYDKLISDFNVALQGRKTIKLSDLIQFDKSLTDILIPTDFVLNLSTGIIQLGQTERDLFPDYMRRELLGDIVNFESIANANNDLFVISCDGCMDEVATALKHNNLSFTIFDCDESEDFEINTNIVLTESEINEAEVGRINDSKVNEIRYLDVILNEDSKILAFRDRNGITSSNHFRFSEDDILKYCRNPVEVISATPGMGKTSLMTSIAKNSPLDSLCILIPLKDYMHFFKTKTSTKEVTIKFFESSKVPKRFIPILTDYVLQRHKIIFLFDGFDEIDRFRHQNVFECVNEIQNFKQHHRVIISTRPNLSNLLKSKFHVNELRIIELDEDTQKHYIKHKLGDLKRQKSEEEIDDIINNIYKHLVIAKHKNLLGTPLLLQMVSESLIDDSTGDLFSIDNITDLFKHFFQAKFTHSLRKAGVENVNLFKQYFEEKLETYEKPALKLCLESDLFDDILNLHVDPRQVQRFRQYGDDLGIIVNMSEDNEGDLNFSFFHNTYAEYFAARWLAVNFNRIQLVEKRRFLLDSKYENIKFMFDIFMAEGCPAHIAVLCRNEKALKNCAESEIIKTDRLKRSVLHLVSDSAEQFPVYHFGNEKKRPYRINEAIKYFQLSNQYESIFQYLNNPKIPFQEKDDFLNSTSLDYADARFSLICFEHFAKLIEVDFQDFPRLANNRPLIFYYSIKFGFINLLKSKHMLATIKNNCAFSHITKSGKKKSPRTVSHKPITLAAKYGQLEVLKHLLHFNNNYYLNSYNKGSSTPLIVASTHGHLAIVKELLQHNATIVDISGPNNETPLIVAALRGHIDVVEELLRNNANVNGSTAHKFTPLSAAAFNGHLDIVKMLLAHKADVNDWFKQNKGYPPISSAARKGYIDIIEELLAHGADINAGEKQGKSALNAAIRSGHIHIVKKLLAYNANVNPTVYTALTPLSLAALHGLQDIFKELLLNNANINPSDQKLHNPLTAAASKGHIAIVKELIKRKAEVNVSVKYCGTPLNVAARNGHLNVVRELLNNNADINAPSGKNGFTPLQSAAHRGHLDIVNELLVYNADINAVGQDGGTALHRAVSRRHESIVKRLLAVSNVDVNASDCHGKTSLHKAVQLGQIRIANELLSRNANVNVGDCNRETPLHIAVHRRHLDLVKMLLNFNADWNAKDRYENTPLSMAMKSNIAELIRVINESEAKLTFCVIF